MNTYVQIDEKYNEVSRIEVSEDEFLNAGLNYSEWETLSNFESKKWRNEELKKSDWIIPITDHPERESYLVYRAKLRDWPSTSDFPNTKPTL
jgi:hypothetical protein